MIKDTNKHITELLDKKKLTENNLRSELNILDESIGLIENNLRRAADQVSSFKKIAVDQSSTELSNFQLSLNTQMLIDTLSSEIKKHSVDIINNISSDIFFYSYVSDYQQILSNLILNALHHGFDKQQAGKIIVDAIEFENRIQLTVRDTGKGIDKNIIKHIYTPFYTSTSRSKGPGLGLSIVYNLVKQRFDGDIQVQSELGEGTTFILDLPKSAKRNIKFS